MSRPSSRMRPWWRVSSTRSFMRLRQRRNVDLPQPEGPIRAVIEPRGTFNETSNKACLDPYQNDSWLTVNLSFVNDRSGLDRPLTLRVEMISLNITVTA